MLNISDESAQIQARFFEAIDHLKRKRALGGINGFAKRYHLSTNNLYIIRKKGSGLIKPVYLAHLVRDFNISAQWLLTGEGDMFKQRTSKT